MERLNEAMALVERQLQGEVDVRRASRIALMSEHHFRRMFSALAGISLSEYVRRRRMTIAAASVVSGAEPLQDIAVRFGYGSADAFSRAFRNVHGVGPERARRPGVVLRSQPRPIFTITIEGSTTMEYRIFEKNEFTLAGLRTRIPLIYEGVNPTAAHFVEQIDEEQWARIADLSDQEPAGVLSVHHAISESRAEGTELDYYIAAATNKSVADGFDTLTVPAPRWSSRSTPTTSRPMVGMSSGSPSQRWRTSKSPQACRAHDDGHRETTAPAHSRHRTSHRTSLYQIK